MQNLPKMLVTVAGHEITAWVARHPDERARGLMHRTSLEEGEGMLFVNGEPALQSFWMKDTPLPLSAAFLRDDGTIVEIVDMAPHCLEGHGCSEPVRHVLEVNQGWFAERGVRPGMQVEGPAFLG